MKTQLLCTFTDIKNYDNVISEVSNFYDILFGNVYILQNKDNLDEIYSSLNMMISDKKYLELGKNAKKFSENFEWSKIIEKYKKILN